MTILLLFMAGRFYGTRLSDFLKFTVALISALFGLFVLMMMAVILVARSQPPLRRPARKSRDCKGVERSGDKPLSRGRAIPPHARGPHPVRQNICIRRVDIHLAVH